MFFRLVVLFFTVATLVLSVWSVIGSYKNALYLTENYLFGFQMSNLNLKAAFEGSKRDLGSFGRDLEQSEFAKRDTNVLEALQQYIAEPTAQVHEPLVKPSVAEVVEPAARTVVQYGPTMPPTPVQIEKRDIISSVASLASGANAGQLTTLIPSVISNIGTNTELLLSQTTLLASVASAANINTQELVSQVTAGGLSQLALLASAASLPASIATLAAGFNGNVNDIVSGLAGSVNASDLGFAEYYSIGYWGYCRGYLSNTEEWLDKLGKFGKQFSNKNVNFTYCSPAKVGFKFDPLELVKHELTNGLLDRMDGLRLGVIGSLSTQVEAEILALINAVTYEDLGLPGNLKDMLNLLHSLTVASFALILAGAVLSFISFVFQVVGLCFLPDNRCLLCLSFMIMVFVFILAIVGLGLSTGTYMYTRKQVNDNVEQFGVKGWLSVQYYAFLWLAVVASLLLVVFAFIGYCCGCFHPAKTYHPVNDEPEMGYLVKDEEST